MNKNFQLCQLFSGVTLVCFLCGLFHRIVAETPSFLNNAWPNFVNGFRYSTYGIVYLFNLESKEADINQSITSLLGFLSGLSFDVLFIVVCVISCIRLFDMTIRGKL